MDQLTCDLKGVAVYLDDILISGADAADHLQNLQALFQRLQDKGPRCKLEKCTFAQTSVEYLGHVLSRQGLAKRPKVVDNSEVGYFKKLKDSLTTENGCLFHASRIVIPSRLRQRVLELIHLGHFGMQRMKQLARTVVYWPHIDDDIEREVRTCSACAEHQNKPPKPANHPWMLPEKPWSRVHVDHTINFLGYN
ncbi:Uncharacterised protein g8033 [Pycnogonum litorale]